MLKIEKNSNGSYHIYLTKGDSATLTLALKNKDGEEFTLEDGDTAVLTIKKELCGTCDGLCRHDDCDTEASAQIEIGNKQSFYFAPSDTAGLPEGTYFFDIEVRLAGGSVYTVIPLSKFTLTKGVS